jgi:hypothetical protein
LLVTLLICSGWWWWATHHGWTVAKVERLIEAEVPRRCSRATAAAWFRRHKIDYTRFEGFPGDMRGHQTMAELAGLRSDEIGETLRGEIDEANLDLICHGTISVYFFFDKQGRLAGHLVHPFVYSL